MNKKRSKRLRIQAIRRAKKEARKQVITNPIINFKYSYADLDLSYYYRHYDIPTVKPKQRYQVEIFE